MRDFRVQIPFPVALKTLAPALLAASLVAGCSGSSSGAARPPVGSKSSEADGGQYVASDARGVHTLVVERTSIPDYLDLPAHIEPDPTRVVRVYPPAGGRIITLKIQPWQHVSKGQTLATLESGDLSHAIADYNKALADDQVKQKQLVRSQDLFNHGAIAERDFQQAQSDARASDAELAATRDQIRVYGVDPDHPAAETSIVAPRSGMILDVGAAPGEYSKSLDASSPLCTIADISTVWAEGDIYEKDLASAKSGQSADVTLSAYPDRHWYGRVDVVSGAVDPATRTLHVRVALANPGEAIKPQMFGSVRIQRSSSAGILIPATAVVREGNDAYVFVAAGVAGPDGKHRFVRRTVTLGRATAASLEILSGLSRGDTIVSDDPLLLRSAEQD